MEDTMTKQADQPPSTQVPVQSDQTIVQDGRWLLLSEAVAATGLSEKTLRRYVKKRILRSKRIGKNTNSPLALWITPSAFQDIEEESQASEADVVDTDFEDIENVLEDDSTPEPVLTSEPTNQSVDLSKVGIELDRILKTITDQFVEKLDNQSNAIFILKNELAEKDVQLRLLPDIRKQLEQREQTAEVESAALKKQVESLIAENEKLRKDAEDLKSKRPTEQKKSWWQSLFSSNEPSD